MNNWKLLNDSEYKQAWDFAYDTLHFSPNVNEKEDLIILPTPNKCFDISNFYDDGFSEELYEDLHKSTLLLFKKISKGKRMYALNYQHDCYSFSADLPFEKDEFGEWLVSIFPNGDYLFFLTSDFDNGVFADGINFRLLIWGEDIIKAFEIEKPEMLVSDCR
ncbi:MAG TPA: DUF2716 domain-containing protein [Chitinophagaceae bacterium]|nr:DUF2716 domain-containing protein [Chitinophagaceae bacterium]